MPHSLRGEGNTLLEAPALDTDTEARIYEVLGATPAKTELLVISYRDGPDEWLADWHQHVGQMPADLGFIHVGEITRSTVAPTSETTQSQSRSLDAVRDPADLTELGIHVSKHLERWADTDNTSIVYLDSITVLLQFVELNDVYRFLHVLNGRIKSVDGHAVYRLDPAAHDSQTIATLQSLVDDVITEQQTRSEIGTRTPPSDIE